MSNRPVKSLKTSNDQPRSIGDGSGQTGLRPVGRRREIYDVQRTVAGEGNALHPEPLGSSLSLVLKDI